MASRTGFRKRIIRSGAGRTFIRGTKVIYIPGFRGYSLYEVWPMFTKQLRRASLAERAAAISFNMVMAIPPTLIFAFTLIPYLPISDRFVAEIFSLIRDIVPGQKDNSVIIGFLTDFLTQPRNELLSSGLLLAILFSSNAMMGVQRSFDKNYPGFLKRTFWQKRQTALKLTLINFVLFLLLLGALIAQGAVLKWLGVESAWIRSAVHNLRWVFILLLFFCIVASIYRHAPALVVRWPFITPGSVFATSLMILATTVVGVWVNNFSNYNKLYGSISAIFVLMLLIFANALAVLIGFELNVTISNLKRKTARREALEKKAGNVEKKADERTEADTNGE
jgi:membrane protein